MLHAMKSLCSLEYLCFTSERCSVHYLLLASMEELKLPLNDIPPVSLLAIAMLMSAYRMFTKACTCTVGSPAAECL